MSTYGIWEIIFVSSSTQMSFLSTMILFPSLIPRLSDLFNACNIENIEEILESLGDEANYFLVTFLLVYYLLCKKNNKALFKNPAWNSSLSSGGVELIIDLMGHSMKSNSSNHTQCMFQVFRIDNKTLAYPFLDMYWSVLILSNLLLGISPLLVITTTFEFIPAQSPFIHERFNHWSFLCHQRSLNSIIFIPNFSLQYPCGSEKMPESPPVTNCGFVYLIFTCMVGLIGLILLSVAAKKYK